MILVDTGIWIDFWLERSYTDPLADLLAHNAVVTHELIIAELALADLGTPKVRAEALTEIQNLPRVPTASSDELLVFLDNTKLGAGSQEGLTAVDTHLLASLLLARVQLWTREKPLGDLASQLGHAYTETVAASKSG